jgi:GTP-binding protein HflX
MIETTEFAKTVQRALLIGVYMEKEGKGAAQSLLEELEELVGTLGVPIADRMLVRLREKNARFLLGGGKAEEIALRAKAEGIDVLIFDHELTPSQQRNWEELAGMPAIDRSEVILDIFGKRAHTREARLQVELARFEHALPRLTGAWGHLVRQGGGIGARGEGETQLEQDRRRIRTHIDRLRKELEQVRSARATQRKDRKRTPVPNAAIVGYTNAGKSSLLRRLTGAEVLVEDKLFATLDTTTRRVALPNKQPLLLTDTVGFVRKLPHQLVESFNATLEEAALSDFLIHLLDASQPEVLEFHQTTLEVLRELGAADRPTIVAFNKIDKVADPAVLARLRRDFPQAQFISAQTGEGLPELMEHLGELVSGQPQLRELRLPHSAGDLLARLHQETQVLESEWLADDVRVVAWLPKRLLESYQAYLVPVDLAPVPAVA